MSIVTVVWKDASRYPLEILDATSVDRDRDTYCINARRVSDVIDDNGEKTGNRKVYLDRYRLLVTDVHFLQETEDRVTEGEESTPVVTVYPYGGKVE